MKALLAAFALAASAPLALAAPPPALASRLATTAPSAGAWEPPPELQGEWPKKPSGKTVSLGGEETVEGAVEKIAQAAGWNLASSLQGRGRERIHLRLKDVPVEEALSAVLRIERLEAHRSGDTITLSPFSPAQRPPPVLTGFDSPSGKTITLDQDNQPVDKALRLIADRAGLSLVLPPGLHAAASVHLREAPVEDALRAVLAQAGLTAAKEGSVLTVAHRSAPRVVVRDGRRHFSFSADAEGAEADAAEDQASARGPGHSKDRTATGDVTLSPGEQARDVVALRGSITLQEGARAREVTAIMGSVTLAPGAVVEREAVAVGGDIHVSPGAKIGRDATSVGGQLTIDPGAEVQGEQTSISLPGLKGLIALAGGALGIGAALSPFWIVGETLTRFAMFFVLGLVLFLLFPKRVEKVTAELSSAPGKASLAGLLGLIALPILTVLLCITLIGIPLVLVEILGVMTASVLGFTSLALLIGRRLAPKTQEHRELIHLALGNVVLALVFAIPLVGTLTAIVAWTVVFGAVLRTRFGQNGSSAPAAPPPESEGALPAGP